MGNEKKDSKIVKDDKKAQEQKKEEQKKTEAKKDQEKENKNGSCCGGCGG